MRSDTRIYLWLGGRGRERKGKNALCDHYLQNAGISLAIVGIAYVAQEPLEKESVHWLGDGGWVGPEVDFRVGGCGGGGVEGVSVLDMLGELAFNIPYKKVSCKSRI